MKRAVVFILFVGTFLVIPSKLYSQLLNDEIQAPSMECEQLIDIKLRDVKITNVEKGVEGSFYCVVKGIIGTEVKFEILLPDKWNGCYLMLGGGGFCGSINPRIKKYVKEGYAVSSTDTGHEGNILQGDWAFNNNERQLNYFHLAVHSTAVVSKKIISKYYNQTPLYSYFMGCSNGGKQGLIEAQLYPDDFDGIVAGAPSIYFSCVCAKFIRNSQIVFPDPTDMDNGIISELQLKVLQEAVLSQCDEIDGVKDNIINYPPDCKFDFTVLPVCSEISNDTVCFTPKQIKAIQEIYQSMIIEGKEVYPNYPIGSEIGWWGWTLGPAKSILKYNFPTGQFAMGTEYFKYMVFNDSLWNYSNYNFSDFFKATQNNAAIHDARATDYSNFHNNGGKIIIYHGWNDPAISVNASIKHFDDIKTIDPSIDNYLKLFLLPGVNHCGGGFGPSRVNWLKIIRNWVENGVSPEKIIVKKHKNGELIMSRPIFAYPKTAVYDGKGNPNLESSFKERE